MKLGLMGGTFSPIHYGHLVAAEECRIRLGLDRVLFIPAGEPPHKRGRPVTPAGDRVAMVELAIADNPGFELCRIEVERCGPSYTSDTLAELRQVYGPGAELYFIVGMDSLSEILTWHEPARIAELARLVAISRGGVAPFDPGRLEPGIPNARERVIVLSGPELTISSTDLRRRVASGLPIRYQVPPSVEEYIRGHGLYTSRDVRCRRGDRVGVGGGPHV
jgi:nicotinate-nucleotide adenylyltransferase